MHIAIIGGGAAGCFAAINIKRFITQARVTVYESGHKPLSKVAITGGGRCNLTNSFNEVKSTEAVYPRGARLMKRLLNVFSHEDVYRWFENEGVKLITQDDQCVFPQSQNAMEIVDTLKRLMYDNGVTLKTRHRIANIEKNDNGAFRLTFTDSSISSSTADIVVVTTGGSPKAYGLDFLNSFNLEIVPPVPSLFSLCLPHSDITKLQGTVVKNVTLGLCGTKIRAVGALLITHWGMSGPAILRLSSYAARLLHEQNYKADMSVNWMEGMNESQVAECLDLLATGNNKKMLSSVYPEHLNSKLWAHLLRQGGLNPYIRWAELGSKGRNKLVATLTNDIYRIDGKNRYKDEFVTCGGVALSNININTLESKKHGGLYFAGEVLDVDAVTGGFNLQAAWTMGYVTAKSIADKYR